MTRPQFSAASGEAVDADIASLNLSRLLSRLEQNLLLSSTTSAANLKLVKQSQYHRRRVRANIDYAQSLALQIERSLPKIKSPERRHDRQTELTKKKASLKLIQDRLDAIAEEAEILRRQRQLLKSSGTLSSLSEPNGEQGGEEEDEDEEDDDGDDEDGEGEDLLAHLPRQEEAVAPAVEEPKERTLPTQTSATTTTTTATESAPAAPTSTEPSSSTTTSPPSSTATTTLRQRHTGKPSSSQPATEPYTSSSSYNKSQLFPPKPSTSSSSNQQEKQPETQTTESKLTTDRHEQDSLTDSLLSLAGQLKASSQAFQSSLEAEKSILNRAVEGLDRNVTGLGAAGQRMNVLRRMSEGRGWWGRIIMYAWIFGLWLVAIGLVYLGPKLRF